MLIINEVNKLPKTEDPLDAFNEDKELLLKLFNNSLETLKSVKTSIQPFCIKLSATLIPFVQNSIEDVSQFQENIRYLLIDFQTKDNETLKQLLYFMHEFLKQKKLINTNIIQASFKRLHDIQQYNIQTETKMMLEATYEILIIYIYKEANEELKQKFNNFFLFCLQSQEKMYYINNQEIPRIPALFVLSMIKNVIKQIGQIDSMSDLLTQAMTTKFQSQQIPDNSKYISSSKIGDLSQVDWSSCSAPLLIYAIKDTKLKQLQAYQALIVNLQVQIACLSNVNLELTFTLIKTLYDELNQIQEKQEWQQVLIYSAILVILRNLQQTRNLDAEFMQNIIGKIDSYLISTQQVKQDQIPHVIDPEQIILDAFKIQNQHYFNFIDLQYFINPLNYSYIINKHTAELNSCLIIEQIICIMQAYAEEKFNPNQKLEEQLVEIALWIYQTLGQSNIPFYTLKITSQFLCKLALNIDRGVDYDENKEKENKIQEENNEEQHEQEQSNCINQLRKRTLEEAQKIFQLLLQIPKKLLNKDESQIWMTPYKIPNYLSLIAFYNELSFIFPKLVHIDTNNWTDFNFLSINLFISAMISTDQTDNQIDFFKLQQLIIKNLESTSKPLSMLTNRFNDIYNLQTDNELLSRKIEINNYFLYLNSLCEIQLSESTPQRISQIFGQIMLDEFIFCNEQDFKVVIQVCQSELFNNLLTSQLQNDNMKHIARRAIVELMIYQYIATYIDSNCQINSFYNKIINYFKENQDVANHYRDHDYFQLFNQIIEQGNGLFVLELVSQVIDFAISNEMQLLQKEKIISLIETYYEGQKLTCQNQMIICLQSLSQNKVLDQFDDQQQETLYKIFKQIMCDYYQLKLSFGVDNAQLYQCIINFYINGSNQELVKDFYNSLIQLCKDNLVEENNIEALINNIASLIMIFRDTQCFKNNLLDLSDLDNHIDLFASLIDSIYEADKQNPTENKIKILDIYIQKYIELLKFFKQEELTDQLRRAFKLLISSIKEENKESHLYATQMQYFFRLLAIPNITQINDDLFTQLNQIILQNPEHIYNEESLQNYKTYILSVYTQRKDHNQELAGQLLFLAAKHDELVSSGAISTPVVQQKTQTVQNPQVTELRDKLSHIEAPTMAGKILIFYKEMIASTDDQEFLISQCEKIYNYTLTTQNIVSNRQHMMIIKDISKKVDDKKEVFKLYKEFYIKALAKENLTQQQFNLFSIIYIFLLTKIIKAQIEIPEEAVDIIYNPTIERDINSLQVKQQLLLFFSLDLDKYYQRFINLTQQIMEYLMPSIDIQYTENQLIVVEQRPQKAVQQQPQTQENQENQEQPQEQQQQPQEQQPQQVNVQESQQTNLKEFLEELFQTMQTIWLNNKDKEYIQNMIISLVKQFTGVYQPNTPNEKYLIDFLSFIISNWPQLTTKYYRALTILFSQQNHLIQIRTKFYESVADVCSFE